MDTAQFRLHAEIEDKHWWFVARRRIAQQLVASLIPPFEQHMIIDVGCGTGGNIAAFREGYRCIGLDPSPEAIRLAQSKYSNVDFRCTPAPQIMREPGPQVDLVMLMDVLEHVLDDRGFFSDIVSAVRPGCYFLITVPADKKLWSPHDVALGHYRRYDLEDLRGVWKGLPLKVLFVSYYNARLYSLAKLVRALRVISGVWGQVGTRAGTDFHPVPSPLNGLFRRIMESEAKVLVDLLKGHRSNGFQRGVSLIAVLRKE